jgi:hypothetical protein
MASLANYYSKRNPKGDEAQAVEAMKQHVEQCAKSGQFSVSKTAQVGRDAIGYKPSRAMDSFISDEASRMIWWVQKYGED